MEVPLIISSFDILKVKTLIDASPKIQEKINIWTLKMMTDNVSLQF